MKGPEVFFGLFQILSSPFTLLLYNATGIEWKTKKTYLLPTDESPLPLEAFRKKQTNNDFIRVNRASHGTEI